MNIKKIQLNIVALFFALLPLSASAALSSADLGILKENMSVISRSINKGDSAPILKLLSPNADQELAEELRGAIDLKNLKFEEKINGYDEITTGKVKLKGIYSVKGPDWNASGFSNFFIFEKTDKGWLLLDTDLHMNLNPETVRKYVRIALAVIFIPFAIIEIFWLWMLVDALRRKFDNKALWVTLIVLLNFIGALVYLITVRRQTKRKRN